MKGVGWRVYVGEQAVGIARRLQLLVRPVREDFVNFVDFDLLDRIVGVYPCHPQARTGSAGIARRPMREDSAFWTLLLLVYYSRAKS